MEPTTPMADKTVLITGGTGGIGRAAAVGLASMGARVGITGRDRARAEAAAAGIARESGNPAVDFFAADLSSQAEVRRLADEVLATYHPDEVTVRIRKPAVDLGGTFRAVGIEIVRRREA